MTVYTYPKFYPYLQKSYHNLILISYICSIGGLCSDILGYYSNGESVLLTLNTISIAIYLVTFLIYLFNKANLIISAYLLIYVMLINILFSNLYNMMAGTPDWQFNFIRGSLILAVYITISGLILPYIHIIIINILYAITLIVIYFTSKPNFITHNTVFFILIIAAFSYAIYLFMNNLKSSIDQNLKLRQQLYDKDKALLEKEHDIIRERALMLEESLNIKNKQLLSNALILTQHIETRNMLIRKLKLLAGEDKNLMQEGIRELLSNISSINSALNWDEFQKRFENVHKDFYHKLATRYPDLSPAEMKLAAFIKLGLSNKEISALSQNTLQSIEVARSRLRKKMRLNTNDNFFTFLSQF